MNRKEDAYENALTLLRNPDTVIEGIAELRNAAEYGNPRAMCEYGLLFDTPGAPVTQNPTEAFQWYLKSAEYGDDRGQFYAGLAYYEGRIVDQDLALALKWFTLSAEKGYAIAQHYLGDMYRRGNGVPRDHREAERWYMLAVDRECNEARVALGDIYSSPKNKEANFDFAFKLYMDAMNAGYPTAFYKVGMMHFNGTGRPVNMITASKCFRNGSELGNIECYYMLGIMYYYGKGVEKDMSRAYRYLNIAEQGKNQDAIDFLAKIDSTRKKKDWRTTSNTVRVTRLNTPDLLSLPGSQMETPSKTSGGGGFFSRFKRK